MMLPIETMGFLRALFAASGAWLDLGSGQGAHRIDLGVNPVVKRIGYSLERR